MGDRTMSGYQTIEIELQNSSSNSFELSKENFGLPVVPLSRIAKRGSVSSRKVYQVFGGFLGFASGLLGGFLYFSYTIGGGVYLAVREAAVLSAVGALVGVLGGQAAGDKVKQRSHAKKSKRLNQLSQGASDLQKPLEILANSTVKTIFYVRKNKFRPKFNITLQKRGSHEAT